MSAIQQSTLRGWKEIANHVGRDVRTVQRWEYRGLPVRRLPGAERGNVYALVSELDAWLHPPLEQQQKTVDGSGEMLPASSVVEVVPERPPVSTVSLAIPTQPSSKWSSQAYWIAGLSLAALLAVAFLIVSLRPKDGRSAQRYRDHQAKAAAHDLYLRGLYFCSKRNPEGLKQALKAFQKATEIDPSYGDAYTGLAQTYELLPEYTQTTRAQAFPQALTAARRAVQLSPNSADAHRVLGFGLFYWEWKTDLAEKEFRLAESLDPKNSETFHWHADALLTLRKMPEASKLIAHARELDPNSSSILADQALIESIGSPDVALVVRQLQELQAAEPQLSSPSRYLSDIFFDHRLYSSYVQSLVTTASRFPAPSGTTLSMVASNGWSHHSETQLLRALQAYREGQPDLSAGTEVPLALICFRLGDTPAGVKALERAYALNDFRVISELLAPALPTLTSVPAFQQMKSTLLERMRATS